MAARFSEPDSDQNLSGTIRPWAALSFRDFRLLWGSSLLAQIGQSMRQLVNFYLVYEITGSTLQLGLTGIFQLIPNLTLGLFGGTLADLMDRKKIILMTLFIGLIVPILAWFLTASGQIQVWHIFAFVTATSLVNVFGGPARTSMLARTIPHSHLMNAFTINSGTGKATMFAGPILAGAVIAWGGVANGYLLSAALFFPAIIGVLLLRTPGTPEGVKHQASEQRIVDLVPRVLATAWEGARFILGQRLLISIFALDIGVTVVSFFRPLLAAFAKDVYKVGPAALGTLTGAFALGAILGASSLLFASRFKRKGLMVLGSTLLYSLTLGVFGSVSSFWFGVLAVGFLGYFDTIAMTIKHATTQIVTPDHLRGRASSALSIAVGGADASGTLVVGLVAAYLGPQNAMLVGSGICIVVVGAAWVTMRTLREYRV